MDKALLTRATSKEDAPTPGYLYGEIARMTQQSFETSNKVMTFLIGRVKNKHHNIKFKALQVIKHVCRDGRVDFKREMQKHIPTIKECLQFRGVPDPLKGDEYYRRVRDAAKECLDAIYDMDSGGTNAGISGRIRGVGNPYEQQQQSSGWGAKIGWGKSSNDATPPMPGGPLPPPGPAGYGGPQGTYGGPQGTYGAPGYPGETGGYNTPNVPGATGGYPPQNAPYGGGPSGPGGYGGPSGPGAPNMGGRPPYGGGPGMSGIGNPMFQDARDDKGFFKGLKEKAASKFSKSDPKPTFTGPPPGSANPPDGWSFATNRGPTSGNYAPSAGTYNPEEMYRPATLGGGYGAHSKDDPRSQASSQLREKAYEGERKRGSVGGVWSNAAAADPVAPPTRSSYQQPTRDMQPPSAQAYAGTRPGSNDYEPRPEPYRSSGPVMGQTSGAASDGTYERNLVMALCAPGGMRAIPPKDKMDAFLKSALTLDADIVGPILEDCLADQTWTVVSKALATIDALLKTDGCDDFFEYFAENLGEIEECTKSDKAAIRDRAVKILSTLGHGTSSESMSTPSGTSSQKPRGAAGQTDLLGGFEDAGGPASPNLFSGLQTTGTPQPTQQQQQHQQQQQQYQQPASTQQVTNMFGGLQIQSNPAAMSAPAAVPPSGGAPAAPAASNLVMDPLLDPFPASRGSGSGMMPGQMAAMQQMAPMQPYPQMQQVPAPYMQQMPYMQPIQTVGSSQVIGAPMTPSGYIAKTIQEPSDESANPGFEFMKKQEDSFNFVKDAMKKK